MGYGLAAHAAESPDKAAIIAGDRTLSYRELHERTNRLANVFRAAGVGEGDRVAAMVPNGSEYFEVLNAAGRLRASLVPVNTHFRREEVAYMVEDSGAKAVVVGQGDTSEEAMADVTSAIRFHIETFGEDVLETDSPVLEAFITEAQVA